MDCSTTGFPVYVPIHHHGWWYHPVISSLPSLLLLPSVFSSIRVFSSESTLHIRWPKYWSFSFSISPSKEYSRLIYFRMDWLDLLGTPKSLLQHHSSKALILQHSAFFIIQLTHLYMTTGKSIALTRCTFVGKVMSLLFNMLSRFVIAFLPRSKCLLISLLQSSSTVVLEPTTSSHVLHYLLELGQIHVCWICDAVGSWRPLSPLSPFAFSLSQYLGLFQWVGSLHQVAKVLDFSISPSNESSGLISFRIDWFVIKISVLSSSSFRNDSVVGILIGNGINKVRTWALKVLVTLEYHLSA